METFDTIVVGAGPAGSTAARELAASGARVLVVERAAEWPRYKACGGGIPIRTERMLPFPITSVVEDTVTQMALSVSGKSTAAKHSRGPFAHMVMRNRFDALLLEHAERAGAELRLGTTVRELNQNGHIRIRAEDGFEAEAKTLICADGAHSPVGKMAGLGQGIAECAAWEVEVRGQPRDASAEDATVLIDLGYDPWGYAWLFPKEEVLSIGIVLPREQAGSMKKLVDRYRALLGVEGADVDIARGHKIRFRRGGEPIASERVALLGDAPGFADEFTAEGISYAVHSGRLGARATLRTLGGDGDLRSYERDVDIEIQPELDAARTIAYMFYGMLKRVRRPFVLAGKHTPFIWSSLFAVQRGKSTYAREAQRVGPITTIANALIRRHDR